MASVTGMPSVVYSLRTADLEFCNLAVGVPCREALFWQFHAMLPSFDTAWAMIRSIVATAPYQEVFRCLQGFTSCKSAGSDRLPWFGVLPWRDHCVGATARNRVVTLAGIVSAIGYDAGDLLLREDLSSRSGKICTSPIWLPFAGSIGPVAFTRSLSTSRTAKVCPSSPS